MAPRTATDRVVVDVPTDVAARLEAHLPGVIERLERLAGLAETHADSASRPPEIVELELFHDTRRAHPLPVVHALMENNLARKGIWSNNPDRERQVFTYSTEDVIGSLTIDYAMGQLGSADMELVAWVLGQWREEQPTVTFTKRGYARALGVAYGGKFAAELDAALERIQATNFKGRVYEHRTKKHVTTLFSIFDTVKLVDRREGFDGPVIEPGSVMITLSKFVVDQMLLAQYVRLDWSILRGKLRSPLAKRLYVFLSSQQGFEDGRYEIGITAKLVETLGSKDHSNPARFRHKLAEAGAEIVAAGTPFAEIRIRARATERGGGYVLSAMRRAA